MIAAIILAGGTGSRMKSLSVPKQYAQVGGHPIIWYVMSTFAREERISRWVIVCEDDYIEKNSGLAANAAGECGRDVAVSATSTECGREAAVPATSTECGGEIEVLFAPPGEVRQLSILNGLRALEGCDGPDASGDSYVVIADAARPLLSNELLARCIDGAMGADGSMPVIPAVDTMYLTDERGHISGLIDRDALVGGQAPEVFRFGKYLDANLRLDREKMLKIHGSSEPAIMAGMDIVTVPGDERNFKITTDEDLERFAGWI